MNFDLSITDINNSETFFILERSVYYEAVFFRIYYFYSLELIWFQIFKLFFLNQFFSLQLILWKLIQENNCCLMKY